MSPLTIVGIVGCVVTLILILAVIEVNGWGISDKTFFEWLDIAIFPLALVLFGFILNRAQNRRDRETEERRRQSEQEADERRRQRELEIEDQRARDAALQAYLEQMGRLLLEMGLREESSGTAREQSTLARAYTLTALERVGSSHKRSVVRFLFEAGLLIPTRKKASVVSLRDANLSRANLADMDLTGINLAGSNLRNADLSNTRLTTLVGSGTSAVSPGIVMMSPSRLHDISGMVPTVKSNLEEADLRGTNLRGAELTHSHFHGVKLRGADLRGADLREVFLTQQRIEEAIGDQTTRLPQHIMHPETWSLPYEEQIERLKLNDGGMV